MTAYIHTSVEIEVLQMAAYIHASVEIKVHK